MLFSCRLSLLIHLDTSALVTPQRSAIFARLSNWLSAIFSMALMMSSSIPIIRSLQNASPVVIAVLVKSVDMFRFLLVMVRP